MLLDAEALCLMCTGALAVMLPEAFIRTVVPLADNPMTHLVVPMAGALAIGVGVMQRGIIALRHIGATRAMLRGRLVHDLMIGVAAMLHTGALTGASSHVVVSATAVSLIFAAVRFHALVLIEEAAAQGGHGSVTWDGFILR
jgi:hypothetical protein